MRASEFKNMPVVCSRLGIELWPTDSKVHELPVISAASCSQLSIKIDRNATVYLIWRLGAIVSSLPFFFFFSLRTSPISVIFSILPYVFAPVHLYNK